MLLIDTNILYYICGLSKPPVNAELILYEIGRAESISISDIAFAEFLTKYRCHVGSIRRVCSFMAEHHIEIQSLVYPHMDTPMIKTLRTIRQKAFLESFEPLLAEKIDVESRLATAVFLVILICESVFECNVDPYQIPPPIYTFFSALFSKILQPTLVPIFNTIYFDSYRSDDAENYVRHCFYNLLTVTLSACIPMCTQVFEACKEKDWTTIDIAKIIQSFPLKEYNEKSKLIHYKILRQGTPAKFVQKKGIVYGKKINDKHLETLLNGIYTSLGQIIRFEPLKKYMHNIIKNIISSGGAFRKNDINDALILSYLKPTDVILSFDSGVISYMQENRETHAEYQNSLNLINSIRGDKIE